MTQTVLVRPLEAWATATVDVADAVLRPFLPSQSLQATTPAVHQPALPLPYVAPSMAGYQTVPLAQMKPEDARAALLAMDLSPQFLDDMRANLHHCTNTSSPYWRPENTQHFVAAYGHLVAMPNGLDPSTVAALDRMLTPPEPSTPQAARQQQALPVSGISMQGPGPHQPALPLPYVAPSVAGYQTVPLAQMKPEDARAALLAMDLSPQFLDDMRANLHHCTNTSSPYWRPENTQHFVAAYGHLVAMPNGLDANTVAALNRMLAPPEPSTPHAARQQQALPVSDMAPEDARAALRAMEVPPQVLAAMKNDVLACVETAGSVEGQQRAQQFRQDYGHLLALPPHMNTTTLSDLVNLVMDLDEVQPQAEPSAARQPEPSPPQAQLAALAAMDPADARQVLLALDVQEQQLSAMAGDLHDLVVALLDESSDEELCHELAHDFAQAHGHLIGLPALLDGDALHALVNILQPYLRQEQEETE